MKNLHHRDTESTEVSLCVFPLSPPRGAGGDFLKVFFSVVSVSPW
jgi:hypothetical protein